MNCALLITFTDNSITIAKSDLRDIGLSTELSLSMRIKNLLRAGAMTVKEIAEALDAKEASVRTILHRMAGKSVIQIGDKWALREL